MRLFIVSCAVLLSLGSHGGCTKKPSAHVSEGQPRNDLPIRIAVAEGTESSDVLPQAWGMVSDQPLTITEISVEGLAQSASKADVLILEGWWVGTAATQNLVTFLPKDWLADYDEQIQPPRRLLDEQTRWNGKRIGVSLGSSIPVMVLAEDASLGAIESWSDWSTAVTAASKSAGRPVATEPWCKDWAAVMFLCRVAAVRPQRWLFSGKTMDPAIAMPEYVAALQQMIDLRPYFPDALMSPSEAWQAINGEELQLAITIPLSASDRALEYRELPNQLWPLTGFGRVACIASGCRQTSAARAFLRWLSGVEGLSGVERQRAGLFVNSMHDEVTTTGNFKYEQLARERLDDTTAHLPTLRIPGAVEYHRALDEQVRRAVNGEASATDALTNAAEAWRKISESRGVARQYSAWMFSQDLPVLK